MDKDPLLSKEAPQNESVDTEPLWKRVLPPCDISSITLLSVGISLLQFTAYRNTGWLYEWSLSNRASLQVVTFLVATALSAAWIYAVCTTINFESRLHIRHRVSTLHWIQTVVALSQKRIDWKLPARPLLLNLLFFSISTVPAALWTGALTAQITTTDYSISLAIPLTGDGAYSFMGPCNLYPQANGTFSLCPHRHFNGQILQSASSATTVNKTERRLHSKLDYTNYRYLSRSYGVGSSVGLTDTDWTLARPSQSYTYSERGFQSKANCVYNGSAVWRITDGWNNTLGAGFPNIYRVSGFFPNSNWTAIYGAGFARVNASGADFSMFPERAWYTTVAFDSSDNIVAFGSNRENGQSFVNIAAGKDYGEFDQIQCEITFMPTMFEIDVSISNGSITVTPLVGPSPTDPDPQELLRNYLVDTGVQGLSWISTSLWTSTVGNSLRANVVSAQVRNGDPFDRPPPATTVLGAVEEWLEAALDDESMALGAASLLFSNTTATAPAVVTRAAASLGNPEYGVALLAIHGLALLAVLVFAVRGRLWQGLPAFDHADWPSLAAATARGGAAAGARSVKGWRGAGSDPAVGRIRAELLLAADNDQPCLALR